MPVASWKYKVNIRHYLEPVEDDDPQKLKKLKEAALGISQEIKRLVIWPSAEKILVDLSKAADTGMVLWFDASLDKLWDWCDENRVWVEAE